ncbi:MAG: aminotransferase class V-fold PLP-dependent enzyme [Clostridiales bacterium]|nr:aminotransferase class V-fold PLP-dependent enzyme [Clostridiales bacterium]
MIYLDNAATTYPKPTNVENAVRTALKKYGANPGRSGHKMAMETSEMIYNCRVKLAEFFGGNEPENVIFTLNCTHALNFVIKGILNKGDHIIISQLEHNAVIRPVHKMKMDNIITYDIAKVYPENTKKTVESFEELIKPNTRAIICTCTSNVFGTVMPIKEIGELAKGKGLAFIVDGAQGAGILPINIEQMNIDYLCMPGHKGLYGPMGTGAIVCREPEILNTIIEGGTGSLSSKLEQPDFYPDRFESGTVNAIGIIGLSAGIDFVKSKSVKRIHDHEIKLIKEIRKKLADNDNIIFYTGEHNEKFYAPVLSFNIEGIKSEEGALKLNDMGFALRAGFHCAPLAHLSYGTDKTGTIRVSPSAFNSLNEAEMFCDAVIKIAKNR